MRIMTALLAFSASLLVGCASTGGEAALDAPQDIIEGVVMIVGAEPLTQATVRTDAGEVIDLVGPGAEGAGLLQGLDVRVTGALDDSGAQMEVSAIEVIRADGVAALQGVLLVEEGRWYLQLEEGRKLPLFNVGTQLQERAGERVWIAAPLNPAMGSWGKVPEGLP